MSAIFAKFDSLNPDIREIILGLVGSAIFALSVVIARFIAKRLAKSGTKIVKQYAENWLRKYLAHRAIFEAKDLPESLRLFFQVVLASVSFIALAGMFLVFVYGVKALTSGELFIFAGHWLAFNCLLEGFLWAKDSRNDKIPKAILEEKQKENQKQIPEETKQP